METQTQTQLLQEKEDKTHRDQTWEGEQVNVALLFICGFMYHCDSCQLAILVEVVRSRG